MQEQERIYVSRDILRAELAEFELRLMSNLVVRRELEEVVIEQGDHEGRIRLLEAWRYALPASIGTAVAALITSIITVIN